MSNNRENLVGSPVHTAKTTADSVLNSPFPWFNSPMCDLDAMSPQSALSFSLSSPPRHDSAPAKFDLSPTRDGIADLLSEHFSPSIFSPAVDLLHEKGALRLREGQGLSSSSLPLFADFASPLRARFEGEVDLDADDAPRGERETDTERESSSSSSSLARRPARQSGSSSALSSSLMRRGDDDGDGERERDAKRVVTFKAKKRAVILTPESTLAPPLLSPDQDGRLVALLDDRDRAEPADKARPAPQSALRTSCNCKKSKCLKLYCDCFAALNHCDPRVCNCAACHNVAAHEDTRAEAIRLTKERNALAFKTKISAQETHVTGCHCKNSHCLKKYCECFNGGALCGGNCKCQSCQNFAGSAELRKTRENSPKVDSAQSKKRKESPNSVAWLSQQSPDAAGGFAKQQQLLPPQPQPQQPHGAKEEKKSHYSLRGAKEKSAPSAAAPSSSHAKRERDRDAAPPSLSLCSFASPSLSLSASQSAAPSSSAAVAPAAVSTLSHNALAPKTVKKQRVRFAPQHHALTYPFFGPDLPEQPKRVALLVLDCLTNQEMFAMSLVNGIWCDATRDDALWEQDG